MRKSVHNEIPIDRACQNPQQSPRGPPRSSTKWLKERPQVSSEDVHYYCYSVAMNSSCSAPALQVPPSHTNVILCEDPRFVDPCANIIIPNCLCFSVKLKFIGSHKENLMPY